MEIVTLTVGAIAANCYLGINPDTRQAIIIDPGDEAQRLLQEIDTRQLVLSAIILTHFHFDHVLAADAVRTATRAPIAIHRLDAPFLAKQPEIFRMFSQQALPGIRADRLLEDGDTINFGSEDLQVIHTPGHSPGGISLYSSTAKVLFSGDTLFKRGIGRTDFPGANSSALYAAIRERIFKLPVDTIVYPGHGPETSIRDEIRDNPFLAQRGQT